MNLLANEDCKDLTALSAYDYTLPKELIAQKALEPRDSSRLMVIERKSGKIKELVFRDLLNILEEGDSLVLNDTKVIPARLLGKRVSGGQAEVFLLKQLELGVWHALVRPGKKLKVGERVNFSPDLSCEIVKCLPDGSRLVKFFHQGEFFALLDKHGHIPLPTYIGREDDLSDRERYQTVYAAHRGAVAAPTAGLHFTSELLAKLSAKGIDQTRITLHVGLGTFRPVKTDDIRQHAMHKEAFSITPEAAKILNIRNKAKRQICVGTTTCRALESVSKGTGLISSGNFDTDIFMYPGYTFNYVDALLTNFHLPGSTLLMLTAAFGGYDLIMEAYAKAVKDRYRFYSYGDAMLIL